MPPRADPFSVLPYELNGQIAKELMTAVCNTDSNARKKQENETPGMTDEHAELCHDGELEQQWLKDDFQYSCALLWQDVFNVHKSYRYVITSVALAFPHLGIHLLRLLYYSTTILVEGFAGTPLKDTLNLCQKYAQWLEHARELHIVFHPNSYASGHLHLSPSALAIILHAARNARHVAIHNAPLVHGKQLTRPVGFRPLSLDSLTISYQQPSNVFFQYHRWSLLRLFARINVLNVLTLSDALPLHTPPLPYAIRKHIDTLEINEYTYQVDAGQTVILPEHMPFTSNSKVIRLHGICESHWLHLSRFLANASLAVTCCYLDFTLFIEQPPWSNEFVDQSEFPCVPAHLLSLTPLEFLTFLKDPSRDCPRYSSKPLPGPCRRSTVS